MYEFIFESWGVLLYILFIFFISSYSCVSIKINCILVAWNVFNFEKIHLKFAHYLNIQENHSENNIIRQTRHQL